MLLAMLADATAQYRTSQIEFATVRRASGDL